MRSLTYHFTGYGGKDVWRALLPERWQAKSIAKILLKGVWNGVDLEQTECAVVMPTQAYRIRKNGKRVLAEPAAIDPMTRSM